MIHKPMLIILVIMILASCGTADGKEDMSSDVPVTVIEVKAENWKFNKEVFKIFSNQSITINFESVEGNHIFAIKGMEEVRINGQGSTKQSFEPGEYQIYCPIANKKGHDEMVATLIAVQKK